MNFSQAFFAAMFCQIALGVSSGYSQEAVQADPSQLVSPGELDSSNDASRSRADKPSVGKYRFEPSASREYLIRRARNESEARRELLLRYQAMGINFAQPTVDGMALHPYPVRRKPFYINPIQPW